MQNAPLAYSDFTNTQMAFTKTNQGQFMLEKGRIIFRSCCCSRPGQSGLQLEKRFEWTLMAAKDMAEDRRYHRNRSFGGQIEGPPKPVTTGRKRRSCRDPSLPFLLLAATSRSGTASSMDEWLFPNMNPFYFQSLTRGFGVISSMLCVTESPLSYPFRAAIPLLVFLLHSFLYPSWGSWIGLHTESQPQGFI